MDQNSLLIFVYGTLRQNCPTGAHRLYLQDAQFISPAITQGSLFLIDYYPGLVITKVISDNETWVTGEVYLLKDMQQLQQLDRYEGCAEDSPKPHEYIRTLIDVKLPGEKILRAWSYVYQGNTKSLAYIASGNFLAC